MTKSLMEQIHFMWIKVNIFMFIGFMFTACGNVTAILDDEITLDRTVKKEELIGKWVLSKESQKYIKGNNADKFYFILDKNGSMEGVGNLDCSSAINHVNTRYDVCGDGSIETFKGEWKIESSFLILKRFKLGRVYIDARGVLFTSKQNPRMIKPFTFRESIGLTRLYHFEFTEKNNKLYVWYFLGDGDSRRYMMYEKKK